MNPQRFTNIKSSLANTSVEELQEMNDNLNDLIQVLMTRRVAVEDEILDRLERVYARKK